MCPVFQSTEGYYPSEQKLLPTILPIILLTNIVKKFEEENTQNNFRNKANLTPFILNSCGTCGTRVSFELGDNFKDLLITPVKYENIS
jgi:hypothetical protein